MVESGSCSRLWDQNKPQTVLEIGSTPASYRPWNSLYVGKLFFHPAPYWRWGGVSSIVGGMGEAPPGQILVKRKPNRIFEQLDPRPYGRDPLSRLFPHVGNSSANRILGWNLSREVSGGYSGPIPLSTILAPIIPAPLKVPF